MSWIFDQSIDPTEYEAIVYLITVVPTGQQYIGKKFLWKRHKGKSHIESDWKEYWSSSEYVKEEIEKYGKDQIRREVIRWCFTKADAGYWEAYEQFTRNVLGAQLPSGIPAYLNRNILGKFFKAPDQKTERAPLKEVKAKVKIGIRLKNKILKHSGTQKAIAEEFGISVSQVAKIKKENKV